MRISNLVLAALLGTMTFNEVQAVQLESSLEHHHHHHHKSKSATKSKDADEKEDVTKGIDPKAAADLVAKEDAKLAKKIADKESGADKAKEAEAKE